MTQLIRNIKEFKFLIIVRKSKRLLVVMENGNCERGYHIALGPNPSGHKMAEGDGRTPEGLYRICHKGGVRRRYFMAISYPSLVDAAMAFFSGRISEDQYIKIKEAYESERCPPFDTPLGGAIGIHEGTDEDWSKGPDWTQGCIGLKLEDAKELFEMIDVGTPVIILP